MFSKELQMMDRNTVIYMIDELQEKIDKQTSELSEKDKEISEKDKEISEKAKELSLKDIRIAELEKRLESFHQGN
ncbi:MAG: hypothetical protein E7304_09685 [Butyrivibrio sp.]|uniref:hypothetical protein n=1 Tax=Butyrivibrio sp. TaxID=28121 RepID=UPI001ED27AFC|nr:hypothetical protein [Butyrivibrio sp.]MBE5841666.1 hypothetical protein [Butyrivibrio sp.]